MKEKVKKMNKFSDGDKKVECLRVVKTKRNEGDAYIHNMKMKT
jgi:hypothetical protein